MSEVSESCFFFDCKVPLLIHKIMGSIVSNILFIVISLALSGARGPRATFDI